MRRLALFLAALLLASPALAAAPNTSASKPKAPTATITISGAFVRAAPEGTQSTAVYMTLQNNGTEPEKLVAAASPAAERVELHKILDNHGLRRMHEIEEIDLPPHTAVALKFGTYHLMLIGLKQPLVPGKLVALDLKFANGGHVHFKAPVVDVKLRKK